MRNWTLVTGGAKRLGAEICLSLAEQNFSLLIHYRHSKEEAESVARQCRLHGVTVEIVQGDFSTLDSTLRFTKYCNEHFGNIKNLINNVGNYLVKPIELTAPEEWNELFQINLHAPFALTQAFLSSIKNLQGNVINLGVSGVNHIHASIERTAYLNTKMSLLMLTKSLAKQLAHFNVCVNMVSPGYLENAVGLSQVNLPMQRPAYLKEVARVILFLLNDHNHYITGQNIEIAGGISL